MLKIQKLYPNTIEPTRAYPTDSGLDLYAYLPGQEITLYPTTSKKYRSFKIHTGIAIQLPQHKTIITEQNGIKYRLVYEAQIRGKSGLASKGIYCSLGTVDNAYTGELKVVLTNISNPLPFVITHGMKIAQLVIQTVIIPDIEYVTEFDVTDRGSNGFGSTGS